MLMNEASSQMGGRLSPEEEKMRRRRNRAIALALVAVMALIFLITLLRLGGFAADAVTSGG
jgi:ferric-dicitrate binding protein FerR (iron transport regulator)